MVAGLFVSGRHRPVSIAVLAMVLAVAVAMATGYTDNARYLLGPLTIALIGGTLAVRALARSAPARAAWDRVVVTVARRGDRRRSGEISGHRALDPLQSDVDEITARTHPRRIVHL